MLPLELYIKQSLELNLFFLRIMKEHAIFLEASFTKKNIDLAHRADLFKKQFDGLLLEAVALSRGVVSVEPTYTSDIVTNFTLSAERTTEKFTAIPIDSNITKAEIALPKGTHPVNSKRLSPYVSNLNTKALTAANSFAEFKKMLISNVNSCNIAINMYPSQLEHIYEEAEWYISLLTKIQNGAPIDVTTDIIGTKVFWDHIMEDHAAYIRGLLDPTEKELFHIANNFVKIFEKLHQESQALYNNRELLPKVIRENFEATTKLRDFKKQGTEGILKCKIKSMILPLLADHVLREANYYLKILKKYITKT